ncbi:hypothetical protein INR49_008044, partial [Caranx melampygus]
MAVGRTALRMQQQMRYRRESAVTWKHWAAARTCSVERTPEPQALPASLMVFYHALSLVLRGLSPAPVMTRLQLWSPSSSNTDPAVFCSRGTDEQTEVKDETPNKRPDPEEDGTPSESPGTG